MSWYNAEGGEVDWAADQRSLVCLLAALPPQYEKSPPGHHLLILCHAGPEPCSFIVPSLARKLPWRLFLNTAAKSPGDVYPELDGPPLPSDGAVTLDSRSHGLLRRPGGRLGSTAQQVKVPLVCHCFAEAVPAAVQEHCLPGGKQWHTRPTHPRRL